MLQFLRTTRPGERRTAVAAFVTLFGIMAGHAQLETARDALFLARLPASQLAWMYLAIAGFVLFVGNVRIGVFGRTWSARALCLWLLVAAGVTLALRLLLISDDLRVLYALYVWSGVLATLAVTRFWSLLGDRVTVRQAKRLFGPIGAGGVLGATAGSLLARTLTTNFTVPMLVTSSAVTLGVAALGPLLFEQRPRPPGTDREVDPSPIAVSADALAYIREQPYPRRVAALVFVSAITLTLVDYLFKSAVAQQLPAERLGTYFATLYLALNAVSLIVQLSLTSLLLRLLGVHRALAVLPIALGSSAALMVASGGLGAALLLRGIDGSLRHSLHRTAVEVLYVPLSGRLRLPLKRFIDGLAQRGGQALAAVAILGLAATAAPETTRTGVGVIIVVLAATWTVLAIRLRRPYLDLFRNQLSDPSARTRLEHPELDLASLESLFSALNSPNDATVRAAMSLLADEGRAHLIPALILYHPDAGVVLAALGLLSRDGRDDFVPIADRLLREHPDDEVRAAALRARTAVRPDPDLLRRSLEDPSSLVQATAMVGQAADGGEGAAELQASIDRLAADGSSEERSSLARAIRHRPAPRFAPTLERLVVAAEPEVRLAALLAIRESRSPEFLPTLVGKLMYRDARLEARAALVALGRPALDYLSAALEDRDLAIDVRRHIPRTIRRFDPEDAAPILLRHLLIERDGITRYKLLRALGRLRADHPRLHLDQAALQTATEQTVRSGFRNLSWRLHLRAAAASKPSLQTVVHRLIHDYLQHKEVQAIERLFRLLGMQHTEEDFKHLHRGVRSADPATRASSRELLDHTLSPPLREPILKLLDDASDDVRLAGAGRLREPIPNGYIPALHHMLRREDRALRALIVYHLGELHSGDRPVADDNPNDSFLLAGQIDALFRDADSVEAS